MYVFRYTLDPSIGEFILTAENLKIPEKSKTIYSINDGTLAGCSIGAVEIV